MKTKRLRGGQSTESIPSKNAEALWVKFFKYGMLPIIFIGIIKDFATGNVVSGGVLLFFTMLLLFIVYLTTLGVEYINNPNGYTIIKAILGIVMLFNAPALFFSGLGLVIIFCIALTGIFTAIF